jgi:hypothetical protein
VYDYHHGLSSSLTVNIDI